MIYIAQEPSPQLCCWFWSSVRPNTRSLRVSGLLRMLLVGAGSALLCPPEVAVRRLVDAGDVQAMEQFDDIVAGPVGKQKRELEP